MTNYRRGVFTKEILEELHEIMASVCKAFEAELLEFDPQDDHAHLLVTYPPQSGHFHADEQSERRLLPPDPKEKLYANLPKTMEWTSLVPKLFCRKLWRRSSACYPTVYRESENT